MKTKKKFLAFSLAFALTMTSLPTQFFAQEITATSLPILSLVDAQTTTSGAIQITPSKYKGDGYEVEFKVTNKWTGAFNGEFILTNTSDKPLENWTLKFDFEREITNMWNAQIVTHENSNYVVKNMGWNQDIEPGSSITIGFQANGDGTINNPSKYSVDMEKQVASDVDYTIGYKLTGNWNSGFNAEISITNQSKAPIEDWSLAFDFDANINNLWTATIVEHTGSHYVIKNKGYNANIAPGQTLTLGFSGNSLKDSTVEPNHYELSYIGSAKGKEEIDYELDSDKDDLPDYYENILGTDPLNADTDSDGIPDGYEYWELMTDPLLMDSDNNISDADEDFDKDSLTNKEEFVLGTDSYNNDSDEDGIMDGDEVNKFGTNPLVYDEIDQNLDTDQDGCADGLEMRLGTEINNPDSDGDGLLDGYEVFTLGTNPLEVDSNNNGINDGDEDLDTDGLTNLVEQKLGTTPQVADTDKDNRSDGDEVNQYHTDPLLYDTDGDTIGDGDEIKLGLNPLAISTNGVPDNEYMIEQTVSEEALKYINTEENAYKLSIDMTASGNAADNSIVSTSQYANSLSSNDAIVGKTISVDYYGGKIEKGTLSFKIDQSTIEEATREGLINSDAQGLKKFYVFNFNEKLNMLVPVPTNYDEANDTLVSDLIGNGTYCVMNVEKWLVKIGAIDNTTNNRVVTNKIATNSLANNYSNNNLLAGSMLSSSAALSSIAADSSNIMPLSKVRQKKVDLVLVVETDYTMEPRLSSVKKGLKDIVNILKNQNLDVEVSIIDVKDVNQMKSPNAILINGTPAPKAEKSRALSFTNDIEKIEKHIDALDAFGGYDYFTAGTQLAGVAYGGALPFREGANKFILLVTDKNTGIKNYHGYTTIGPLFADLKAKNISFSVSTMNKDLGGTIPDMTVQNYKRCIARGNGIFVPLRNFDFEVNIFTDFVVTNLIEQKEFTILGNTDLEKITLDEPLVKGGQTDSDDDSLTDSEEVDWSNDRISYSSDGYELPTLQNLWFDIDKGYDYDLEDFPFSVEFSQIKVLPLLSHPLKVDSDNDGKSDYEDSMPFRNDYKVVWSKASNKEHIYYFGQLKYNEDSLRLIDYTIATKQYIVKAYINGTWQIVDEQIELQGLNIGQEVGSLVIDADITEEGKIQISHPDMNIVFNLDPFKNFASQMIEQEIEDNNYRDLGIQMGIIDSCLMPYDMGLELWGGPGTSKPVNFTVIPSSSKIKMCVLTLLGYEETDLQENETYLRAKIQTEDIVSIVSLAGVVGGIAKLIEGGIKFIGGTCFTSGTGGASIPIAIAGVGDVALGIAGTKVAYSIGTNSTNQSNKDKENLKKLSKVKLEQEISKIAKKYNNLECVDCANEIKEVLKKNNMNGRQINLKYKGGRDYIWSDTANKVISENGFHTAIEFNGRVYDNVHTTGIEYQKWLDDFLGTGERIIDFMDF